MFHFRKLAPYYSQFKQRNKKGVCGDSIKNEFYYYYKLDKKVFNITMQKIICY